MKKYLLFLAIMVIIVSVYGCSKNESEVKSEMDTGITVTSADSTFAATETEVKDSEMIEKHDIDLKGVKFYSVENKEAEAFLLSKEEFVRGTLTNEYGKSVKPKIAKPITVRNGSLPYFAYVPVLLDDKCVGLIYIYIADNGNEFSMQYGRYFADAINSLKPNTYYFEFDDDPETNRSYVYLIGPDLKIAVEGNWNRGYANVFEGDKPIEVTAVNGEIEIDLIEDMLD